MNVNRFRVATVAVALLGIAATGCAPDGPDSASGAFLNGAGAAASAAGGELIEFVASEFGFSPTQLDLAPGTHRGVLVNDGAIEHDITFEGGAMYHAAAGQRVEFDFTVPEGGLRFWCSISGHEDAGMVGTISAGAAATASEASDGDDDHAGPAAEADVEPNPDAAPYALMDPHAPARGEGDGVTLAPGGAPDGGDLIEVEMVVEEKLMTVAEGYEQLVWTFNGTAPGPVIRTRVGDTVRVHLVNPPESEVSHSVDFHSSQVAWNDEMRSIAPGEELVYEFTTDYAGVWMYHCGTSPALHHIANGMFGMVIVEPPDGLAPVSEELFFVQSEWYLGAQGETASLAKAAEGAPSPDLVMFNGVAKQYLDNPIEIPVGEEVRLFVLNVGPSMDSAFHVVGTIFDTVIKEGVALQRGNEGGWGAQAVDLAPSQGAVVELQAAEDGLYPLVTHAFNFPGRGAIGVFQAGDGQP